MSCASPRPPGRASRWRGWGLLQVAGVAVVLAGAIRVDATNSSREVTVRSRSGQFIVHSPLATGPSLGQSLVTTNLGTIAIQPDPLAVSAERIRRRLLVEFGLPDQWQGRIHLFIFPDTRAGTVPIMGATRFADGWQYSIQLPARLDPQTLTRVILQALLTELANRTPGPNAPELPIWFVEGLAAEFLATSGPDLVVQTNELLDKRDAGPGLWGQLQPSTRQVRIGDLQRAIAQRLREEAPLSFNELALPEPTMLQPANRARYTLSAQVFVRELLELPDARRMICNFLARLPRTLNWQTAFIGAFQVHFPTLADAEKWWAVTASQVSGFDKAITWERPEALERFAAALSVPVDVHRTASASPSRQALSPQRVLVDLDQQSQMRVLRTKVSQLERLREQMPEELVPLVNGYISAFEAYLEARPKSGYAPIGRAQSAVNPHVLLRDTTRQLDQLDRVRAAVATAPTTGPVNQATNPEQK